MSWPLSGSRTVRSAFRTASSVTPPDDRPPKRPIAPSLYGTGLTGSSNGARSRAGRRDRGHRGRLLLAALLLLVAAPAGAEPRLEAGTAEFALSGGHSEGFALGGSRGGIRGFQLLPHLGLIVTDEHGPTWLRGSLELIGEPTFIHLDARKSDNHAGLSMLGRWVLAGESRVRWYLEAGAGTIVGNSGLPQTICNPSFVLQAGGGVLLFWSDTAAVNLGTRFQHISNAGVCSLNPGLNSALFTIGFSTFFK
jgi:hypothetical protein